MAPRDYKNRGKAPRKAPTAEPTKSRTSSKIIIVGVLTLIVTVVFAYGLWSIKGSAPTTDNKTVTQTPAEAKPLPAKPVEQWQYIDELKDKEVVVEVPSREKSNKRYQMQCASFRQSGPANEMKAKIAFLGIESMIKVTTSNNGKKWHRVVLGPYLNKREAEKERHILQNNKINGCKIWGWTW